MKKPCLYLATLLMVLTCACSKDKQLREFADEFTSIVKSNNLEALEKVYPEANFESVGFQDYEEPTIEKVPEDGEYRINFGPSSWIQVRIEGDNIEVTKSHGIAQFPEDKLNIARKTGMVNDELSDVKIQERLSDQRFFNWIKGKENIVDITVGGNRWIAHPYAEGGWAIRDCEVTNTSNMPIAGKDYSITYTWEYENGSDGFIPNGFKKRSKAGVDLMPGETKKVTLKESGVKLHNVAVQLNLPQEQINRMTQFTGDEYAEFIKLYGKPDPTSRKAPTSPEECLAAWPMAMPTGGSLNQFAWLADYKLSSKDLKGFSTDQLRILRNSIFARHGYIFKSDDLKDYFGNFSDYAGTTKNVTDFNKTEQANINTIKNLE